MNQMGSGREAPRGRDGTGGARERERTCHTQPTGRREPTGPRKKEGHRFKWIEKTRPAAVWGRLASTAIARGTYYILRYIHLRPCTHGG